MISVVVEFIGPSRILSDSPMLELKVSEKTTYNQIVKMIAKKQPKLLGQLIDPETYQFYGSNMFNLNGERMIRTDEMDQLAHDGDHLSLLSIFSGGNEGKAFLN